MYIFISCIGLLLLTFVIVIILMCLSVQEDVNKKLQVRIASLTAENIELEKNFEECKQTIKVLQKLYRISDKTLELHTLKSGYPSKLVNEHFDELV